MPARTDDGQRPAFGRIGGDDVADGEPAVGVVSANFDPDLALNPVGPADAPDDELHRDLSRSSRSATGGQRPPSTSTRSTRTDVPPSADITVRSAFAVRPIRPMTLPRSSG